jgi:hypothetical protein
LGETGRRGRPRRRWELEEIFGEPNPRYASDDAALEAGWRALLVIAALVFDEMERAQKQEMGERA